MKLLDNKIALITGGSRGIGESIVKIFAKQGAKVIFTFKKSKEKADKIKYSLNNYDIKCYKMDINNQLDIFHVIEKIIKNYNKIDILINNVGITSDNLLLRMKNEDWNKVIDTNLKSIFYITKLVVKYMIKERNGSIINMSSIVGLSGNIGQINYSASKAGIIGFTKSLAKEIGSKNIRCNAIAPGLIDTDMTNCISKKIKDICIKRISLKRIGNPIDIANACLFLASNLSNYITGEILNVSGGIL